MNKPAANICASRRVNTVGGPNHNFGTNYGHYRNSELPFTFNLIPMRQFLLGGIDPQIIGIEHQVVSEILSVFTIHIRPVLWHFRPCINPIVRTHVCKVTCPLTKCIILNHQLNHWLSMFFSTDSVTDIT